MTTAEKALFIASNVHVIANREDAGQCLSDVRWMVEAITKQINRPLPLIEAGPCPTIAEDQKPCGNPLQAKRGEVELTCPKCGITYNVQELIDYALDSCSGLNYSERDVLQIMASVGRHIPRNHWWNWKQRGVIVNRNEWGAEPMYRLEDVQRAYEERVGKRRVG